MSHSAPVFRAEKSDQNPNPPPSPKPPRIGASLLAFAFLGAATAAGLAGCATEPPSTPPVPSWVRQTGRIEGEDRITFVETEDDSDPAIARAKSEGLALEDVANECSLIPSGARVEERYEMKTRHLTQSFARVSVPSKECAAARGAVTADAILVRAHRELTDRAKAFRAKFGQPNMDSTSPDPDGSYFLTRQRLALLKHELFEKAAAKSAPPRSILAQIASETKKLVSRELSEPQLRQGNQTWSKVRRELMRAKLDAAGKPMRAGATSGLAGDEASAN